MSRSDDETEDDEQFAGIPRDHYAPLAAAVVAVVVVNVAVFAAGVRGIQSLGSAAIALPVAIGAFTAVNYYLNDELIPEIE